MCQLQLARKARYLAILLHALACMCCFPAGPAAHAGCPRRGEGAPAGGPPGVHAPAVAASRLPGDLSVWAGGGTPLGCQRTSQGGSRRVCT